MNIQSVSNNVSNCQPVFKGRVNEILRHVPDTKVSRGLTELDKCVAKFYVTKYKPLRMGITAEDITELSKFDGIEFIQNSYIFLLKKLGINSDIAPQLVPVQNIQSDIDMAYQPLTNIVYVDMSKCANFEKGTIFAALRHELQHFLQNSMIIRHEEIGPRVIEESVKKYELLEFTTCKNLIEMYTPEQIKELAVKNGTPDLYNYVMKFKSLFEEDNMTEIDKLMQFCSASYKQDLLVWRDSLVKNLGIIKADSALTSKIEKYYEDFSNVGYYNPDGSLDLAEYVKSSVEKEAFVYQDVAGIEFAQDSCPIKYYKQKVLEFLKCMDANNSK